jgi:hypothetical protein
MRLADRLAHGDSGGKQSIVSSQKTKAYGWATPGLMDRFCAQVMGFNLTVDRRSGWRICAEARESDTLREAFSSV